MANALFGLGIGAGILFGWHLRELILRLGARQKLTVRGKDGKFHNVWVWTL